ncbi:MAG: Ger(x)C family spore germination protein [Lachnospiraceae bacterium]|jgi:spore germination protein KC|nr:Ger(x)C family spore germination protein [Lachnospiraceae bacterium]
MRNTIAVLLIITVCLFSLTGCYDARSIETLSYAIAIGIDEGETNMLKLTVQFVNPSSMGSNKGGSTSSSEPTTITSVECASLDSGINIMNSFISRQINLSQCRIIVFSETIAEKGISEYLYTLTDNIEIRPNCNIVVSTCSAEEFLQNSEPASETLLGKYYDSIVNANKYTGSTDDIELSDFFTAYKDTFREPYAVLAGINSPDTPMEYQDASKSTIDSGYVADKSSVLNDTFMQSIGIAVFRSDKLVGELNVGETISHLLLSNRLHQCHITVPSPFSENGIIDLRIIPTMDSKKEVTLVNNTPYITCEVFLSGEILSSTKGINFTENSNIDLVESYVDAYMEQQISEYLYKTSKDFKSDIIGFGSKVVGNYLTTEDWVNSNWLDNYQNSFFDVTVVSDIKVGETFSKID